MTTPGLPELNYSPPFTTAIPVLDNLRAAAGQIDPYHSARVSWDDYTPPAGYTLLGYRCRFNIPGVPNSGVSCPLRPAGQPFEDIPGLSPGTTYRFNIRIWLTNPSGDIVRRGQNVINLTIPAEIPNPRPGSYTTQVERAWDKHAIPEYSDITLPEIDYSDIPAALLPFKALEFSADLYTKLLGEQYERNSIKNADFIHRQRTTWAAIDLFAALAGFHYTYRYNTAAGVNTSIIFQVTPSIRHSANTPYTEYVAGIFSRLLPFWLPLHSVEFLNRNLEDVYYAAAVRFYTPDIGRGIAA